MKENSNSNESVINGMNVYLQSIAEFPRLTLEKERELSHRARRGDQTAINELVESNLQLVISVAKQYTGYGVPFPDIVQEGNCGLLKAAKNFNSDLGFRFSTFATSCIKQEILNSLDKPDQAIHIPKHIKDLIGIIKKANAELSQTLNRDASADELAEYLKLPYEKIQKALEASRSIYSLDTPLSDDEDFSLMDTIVDPNSDDIGKVLINESNREIIEGVLKTLKGKEAEVIRLRFGLTGKEPMTLEEIGSHYGVTRARIKQIEDKALRKLRQPLRMNILKEAY
jgi:RNA polymerase primary sigma factor